jgi:hypothetical protein
MDMVYRTRHRKSLPFMVNEHIPMPEHERDLGPSWGRKKKRNKEELAAKGPTKKKRF